MSLTSLILFWLCVFTMDPSDPLHGIYNAARCGDEFQLALMLKLHPHLVDSEQTNQKYGRTPLQHAAENNQIGAMRILLANRAGVNHTGGVGLTPLQFASHAGHREAATALLKHGSYLDLFSAAALGQRATVERQLQVAAALGRGRRAANSRRFGPYFQTTSLVNWAVVSGDTEMIELLVRFGAELEAPLVQSIAWQYTPLQFAAERDQDEVIKTLIKLGAKLEAKDGDGHTALHTAAKWGKLKAARVLLEAGAKIDNREDRHAPRVSDAWLGITQNTVIHSAVEQSTAAMVALLLAHGSDVNACNARGQTPLDLAEAEFARDPTPNGALTIKLLHRYGATRKPR